MCDSRIKFRPRSSRASRAGRLKRAGVRQKELSAQYWRQVGRAFSGCYFDRSASSEMSVTFWVRAGPGAIARSEGVHSFAGGSSSVASGSPGRLGADGAPRPIGQVDSARSTDVREGIERDDPSGVAAGCEAYEGATSTIAVGATPTFPRRIT